MRQGLYVVYDNKAEDTLGFIQLHKHEAVAVRTFTDIATHAESRIKQHPEDYDLIRLGYLEADNLTITPEQTVILTGKALFAAMETNDQ